MAGANTSASRPPGGTGATLITESDILGPSEEFRAPMDYYAHAPHTEAVLERLARERPQVLACMPRHCIAREWGGAAAGPGEDVVARPLAAAACAW